MDTEVTTIYCIVDDWLKACVIKRVCNAPSRSSSVKSSTEGMVRLDGGTFLMGIDSDEGFPADGEGPVREVHADPSISTSTT